ncbi:protein PIGBOS1 isoform X1 [Loxodonta africana]|uniref:protein PIGBOS1 isoform X1 n=2 Tax=Loxodonta africana TaxID=9785 RepID=UPI000C812E36|nr:protein PIGBOS1 isoform X1 [Loxodonta africana]
MPLPSRRSPEVVSAGSAACLVSAAWLCREFGCAFSVAFYSCRGRCPPLALWSLRPGSGNCWKEPDFTFAWTGERRDAEWTQNGQRSEEISWTCTLSKPPLHCAAFVETMFGRLTLPQWLFASILGIAGGVYIYQPIFEQYSRDQQALKEELKVAQESEEKKN